MYNRYIPNGLAYTRVLEEDAPPIRQAAPQGPPHPQPSARREQAPHQGRRPDESAHRPQAEPAPSQGAAPSEKKVPFLSGLLKRFKLDDLDTGDILLLLILLFLVLDGDGDNLELIITLGLVILFSLGDKGKEKESG